MDNIPNGLYIQGEDIQQTIPVILSAAKNPLLPAEILCSAQNDRRQAALAPAMKIRLHCLLLAALFIIYASFALFLISSSQPALAQGNTFIVTILGSSQQPGFAPDLLTVHIYDTVVFVNSAAAPIAITAADSSFASPAISPGKQWKVTFNSAGAFEYHDNSNPAPHIFGEIVVVPDTVALLPPPAPAAQQTAIASIQSGKTPPDTVWQQTASSAQTPVAISHSQNRATSSLSVPPLTLLLSFVRPVILVVIVLFALSTAGLSALWLYRRRESHQKKDDDDDEEDDDDE